MPVTDAAKPPIDWPSCVAINEPINELRSVTGDNAGDGSTSSMLKSLEKETKTIAPNVINVQNNNSIANNTSGGSSATIGFNIHEPDNTFKYVRQGSTASNDF